MTGRDEDPRNGPRMLVSLLVIWVILILIGLGTCAVMAAEPDRLVVRDDPGGAVMDYAARVQQLGDQPVVIDGRCMSACTLYLGARNVCITRGARLYFHGPSSQFYGLGLPPDEFDAVSRFMGNHYPEQIKDWFIGVGRYRLVGFFEMGGAEAIALGAKEC